jgi:pimeloyl-ACP methyl ester carboxylesterase
MTKSSQANARSADVRLPGVVLLHGIARTSRSLNTFATALQASGFATLNLDYASRKKPLATLAADIHPDITAFASNLGGPVHFVAHSMGGLLTRIYVARYRPAALGRVVMLGTPNGGSEVADLLKGLALYRAFYGPAGQQLTTVQDADLTSLPPPDYAVGIIAGVHSIDPIASRFILPRPNDGRVSVHSAQLANMTDHTTVRASHSGLLRHRVAINQTISFLRDGRFKRSDDQQNAASSHASAHQKRSKPYRRAQPRDVAGALETSASGHLTSGRQR